MNISSIDHNLLHALQWEIHDFRVSNAQERWNLTDDEKEIVEKWILSRIQEIKEKMNGS
jgi:hypothetical protein